MYVSLFKLLASNFERLLPPLLVILQVLPPHCLPLLACLVALNNDLWNCHPLDPIQWSMLRSAGLLILQGPRLLASQVCTQHTLQVMEILPGQQTGLKLLMVRSDVLYTGFRLAYWNNPPECPIYSAMVDGFSAFAYSWRRSSSIITRLLHSATDSQWRIFQHIRKPVDCYCCWLVWTSLRAPLKVLDPSGQSRIHVESSSA